MKSTISAILAGLLFLSAAPFTASAQDKGNLLTFPQTVLEVQTATETHSLTVELALDGPHWAQGLMFREEMGDDAGMMFVFPGTRVLSFWMKNTILPLDIIYADSAGKIVHIAYDAVPGSLEPIPSVEPARVALEINAGQADAKGIQVGDLLIHPAFPLPEN